MNLNEIVQPVADFLQWTFEFLPMLGEQDWFNFNNVILWGGFVGVAIWVKMQGKFNQEAEETGGMK